MFKTFYIILLFLFFNLQSFAFDVKMSDSISPFFNEKKEIKNYSTIPFYQLDIYSKGKLVDENQLENSLKKFEIYLEKLKNNAYNSISLDDLNHLLLFEQSGFYDKSSKIYKRNKIYISYYKKLIKIAKSKGLDVYINTDIQFYTNLLEEKIGKIRLSNNKLELANKEAFEEIFKNFPDISGMIFRVGEGGKNYNYGDYKSKIIYKNPKSVNNLLKKLLPTFEKHNKKLIFRTWTIGIGDVGNLVFDKNTYDDVFEGINSKNLIVSIKHTPGDYFWFDDLNPTIGYGNLQQIVEFQVRREYEGGGDYPNYIGDYYKSIFLKIKDKKNVIGVYNWNQTGGWGWGKNVLFNFGFNFWNEINFYSVGNVLKFQEPRLNQVLDKYNFSKEEKDTLFSILKNSRKIIKKGWYINDFRKKDLEISNIKIPPLSRIWWDKVTSSPVILSLIFNSLDDKYSTVEESAYLLGIQKKEIESWGSVMKENDLNLKIYFTLENRYRIFQIIHIFKKSFIGYFETGKKDFFSEIDSKIKSYNSFSKDKSYINFDFSEIYKFYSEKNFSIFWLFINLISFLIYVLFFINYKKIKYLYRKNFLRKIVVLSFLSFDILVLVFSPLLFLSKYNIYWFLTYISVFLTLTIFFYFFIVSKILSFFHKLKIKLEKSLGKIIYFLAPIIFVLEFIIIFSFLFGEQFFWKIITMGFFGIFFKFLLVFLLFLYLYLFVHYGFKFSNIHKFFKGNKHIKKTYFLVFLILPLFLLFLFSLDYTKIILENSLKNILPSYFFEAGSGVGEFF